VPDRNIETGEMAKRRKTRETTRSPIGANEFSQVIYDELVKSLQKDGFVKSSRCKARKN
jgi:hypothetical protein